MVVGLGSRENKTSKLSWSDPPPSLGSDFAILNVHKCKCKVYQHLIGSRFSFLLQHLSAQRRTPEVID